MADDFQSAGIFVMVDFTTQNPVTLDTGMVAINFTATNGVNVLSDAIVLTPEAFAVWTDQNTVDEQQRRWNNWLGSFIPLPDVEVMSDG